MIRGNKALLLSLALSIGPAACNGDSHAQAGVDAGQDAGQGGLPGDGGPNDGIVAQLRGREFLLDHAEGFTRIEGVNVSLRFFTLSEDDIMFPREKEFLSTYAGCDLYQSPYSVVDGNKLVLSDYLYWGMLCDEPRMLQDEWIIAFLFSEPTIAVDGNWLTLTSGIATLTFLDAVVAAPDMPLTGQKWEINALMLCSSAFLPIPDSDPWVSFSTDGTISVFTGCNEGTGTYEATETKLTFGKIDYTETDCTLDLTLGRCFDSDQFNNQDQFFKQTLVGSVDYHIRRKHLSIWHEDGTGLECYVE